MPSSSPSSVADAGEQALVDLIRRRVPPPPAWVHVGIGDDAAVVARERNALDVFTTDALVDGIHFDRRWMAPADIGHRALAVNLSDLAAMGATPRLALLSLALPAGLPVHDLEAMLDGLLALGADTGTSLVGGNITRIDGPMVIGITAVGCARPRRVLLRSGARPGDHIWVSGAVGAAAAGLESLKAGPSDHPGLAACRAAFLRPAPRLRLGARLAGNRTATSCVDLSDGLADGLHQLAAASRIGAVIDASSLPIPEAARRWFEAAGRDPVLAAVAGGDDYELLFTVPPRRGGSLRAVRRASGPVEMTRIGTVTEAPGVVLVRDGRRDPMPGGYAHFR